jgi:hypothetical protein
VVVSGTNPTFGMLCDLFEELAARFDFHYYPPMDC